MVPRLLTGVIAQTSESPPGCRPVGGAAGSSGHRFTVSAKPLPQWGNRTKFTDWTLPVDDVITGVIPGIFVTIIARNRNHAVKPCPAFPRPRETQDDGCRLSATITCGHHGNLHSDRATTSGPEGLTRGPSRSRTGQTVRAIGNRQGVGSRPPLPVQPVIYSIVPPFV